MKLSQQQKIDLVKKRLNLGSSNPFDKAVPQTANKNNVLNKRFSAVQDERPSAALTERARNFAKTREIREKLPEKASFDEANEKAKTQQEIYMEIIQKSKAAKKERQLLKEELDEEIRRLDQQFNKAAANAAPLRKMSTNEIQRGFAQTCEELEGQQFRRANQAAGTTEEAVRIGAEKLHQLDKKQSGPKFDLDNYVRRAGYVGGDDEELQYIVEPEAFEAPEDTEEFGEDEREMEAPDLAVDTTQEHLFSENLKQLPFSLEIPGDFGQFQILLNSVEPCEELLVLDRMIKTNSTYLCQENSGAMQLLASHLIHRLLQNTESPERLDAQMRALRHCAVEQPSAVAGLFQSAFQHLCAQMNSYYQEAGVYPSVGLGFIILLRVYEMCFLQAAFTDPESPIHSQSLSSFFLVAELAIYKAAVSGYREALRYLFLIEVVAAASFQCGKYAATIIFGLKRLLGVAGKLVYDAETNTDGEIQFEAIGENVTAQLDTNAAGSLLRRKIADLTALYFRFFKLNLESIPTCLARLVYSHDSVDLQHLDTFGDLEYYEVSGVGFVVYNWNENFLKERQFAITELDPLYMKNFNPKKTNDLDIDRQKARIEAKQLKRKSKDEFRKEVREIKKKMIQKQSESIQKSMHLKQVRSQTQLGWSQEKRHK